MKDYGPVSVSPRKNPSTSEEGKPGKHRNKRQADLITTYITTWLCDLRQQLDFSEILLLISKAGIIPQMPKHRGERETGAWTVYSLFIVV